MKRVLVIPDGAPDAPVERLGGQTPLAVARTPGMDRIASHGHVARVRLTPEGFSPGTDICHLELLGFPAEEHFTGRAPLEAASLGLRCGQDEVVYRCNLVTLSEDRGQLLHFAAGYIPNTDSRPLVSALADALDGQCRLVFNDRFHHLAVFRSPADASPTMTHPPHQIMGRPLSELLPSGPLAGSLARATDTAARVLRAHPVNLGRVAAGALPADGIWLWGGGRSPRLPGFGEIQGLTAAIITAVPVLEGIARLGAIEVLSVPGATGGLDTDYAAKGAAAIAALDDFDLVFVHVDAPDEAAHLMDVQAKVDAISAIDAKIITPLLRSLSERAEPFRIGVLPDHYTFVDSGAHGRDPTPLAHASQVELAAPARADRGYDETAAAATPELSPSELHRLFFRRAD